MQLDKIDRYGSEQAISDAADGLNLVIELHKNCCLFHFWLQTESEYPLQEYKQKEDRKLAMLGNLEQNFSRISLRISATQTRILQDFSLQFAFNGKSIIIIGRRL